MRVGLNAQLLYLSNSYRAAGISRYIYQLLAHLRLQVAGDDRLVAFTGRWKLPPDLQPTPGFQVRATSLPTWRPPARIAWEQLLQPLAVARERLDLLHSLSYVQPLVCPARSVVTVLDLTFLRMPESFNRWNRAYLATMARLSARRCDRVVAISESTKRDVVRFLGVPPDRVEVIYCGVDPAFRPIEDPQALRRFRDERGLPERFLLHLGTLEPRKNVGSLLEAYARLRRGRSIPHKLVLGGARGWLYDRLFARVRELRLEDDVIFASFIPDDELPLWYNAAEVFIYPSLYEGFGLPPLEAMACGTPVVASSASSLPEVVGTAGITVDPMDVDALAEGVAKVLDEPSLRQRLRSEGLRRAARFSWDEAAARTLRLYRAVLSE